VLTALLFVIVPKGFFPVQDTGVIVGVTEAPQTISFAGLVGVSRRWSRRS
jgi:multidrug efflux pump